MAKGCRRLFQVRVGQYVYSTYFIQAFCDCKLWAELHEICKDLAKNNLDKVPEYQILSPTPTGTHKIVTLVRERNTEAFAAFASAVIFIADGQGECLHLGLSIIDTKHREKGLGTALNFFNVSGFSLNRRRLSFFLTNVSTSPAILHTVGKYLSEPYPFFDKETPGEVSLRVAQAFDAQMRREARLNETTRFCGHTFVFLEGNKGNEFYRPDGGEPIAVPKIQQYYEHRTDNQIGDVILQVGKVSPFSLLRGGMSSRFRKLIKGL